MTLNLRPQPLFSRHASRQLQTYIYTLVLPLCTTPTLPWRSLAMSFLQIWAKTPAGLLAAWDPVCVVMKRRKSRRKRRRGKSFCRCEASRWRCVSYRHDNLGSSALLLLLLLRFRRLTLHSGYDGWNDSAKTSGLRPRGKLRPPPAETRKHTNKQEKLLLLLLWYT